MTKNRLEAFTDAVIAIIMTILVLELHQPGSNTWSALIGLEHKILIYVISFFTLVIYWNNHHHLFLVVKKINGQVLWRNSIFIFSLSLFPFATAWISEYINSLVPELIYGLVTLFANVTYYFLARELAKVNKKESIVKELLIDYRKSYLSIGLNILGLLLGWLVAPIAVLIVNVLILLMWIIPIKKVEQYFR